MDRQTPDEVLKSYKYLEDSPMFKFSLSSRELFHSNFLEWLSNVDKDAFRKMINEMVGDEKLVWPRVWRVKREFKNFDLCVVAYDKYSDDKDDRIEDDPDFRLFLVLENKVKSIPYQEQLQEYAEKATSFNKVYWGRAAKSFIQEKIKSEHSQELRLIEEKKNKTWKVQRKIKPLNKRGKWQDVPDQFIDLNNLTSNSFPIVDESSKTEGVSGINKFSAKYTEKMMGGNPVHFILLSLAKTFPNCPSDNTPAEWKINGVSWMLSFYQDYLRHIREHYLDNTDLQLTGLTKAVIKDYYGFVESLCYITEEWSKEYEDEKSEFRYNSTDSYEQAHRLRIHDLYQKLKFSYLCAKLYEDIKDLYKNTGWTVFPSNQGGLFNDSNFEINGKIPDQYICVNYTYLHGEPLLEINIRHTGSDFYYAIQVQGNAYEHGIQVKADRDDKKRIKPIYAEDIWDELKKGKRPIKDKWMSISNSKWETSDVIIDNQNTNERKYDMSNGTFVYQSREIRNRAKIGQVLDLMKTDLNYIIQP